MNVLYWNRTRLGGEEEQQSGSQLSLEFDDVLSQSDFVSIHVALCDQTRHLIDEPQLATMKPTACIINTARGPVIHEKALVRALQDKKIASAALDVYEHEPRLESELYDMPNVVIAPHLGSATIGTRTKMGNMAAENCLAACAGRRPPNLVNPQIYD